MILFNETDKYMDSAKRLLFEMFVQLHFYCCDLEDPWEEIRIL